MLYAIIESDSNSIFEDGIEKGDLIDRMVEALETYSWTQLRTIKYEEVNVKIVAE